MQKKRTLNLAIYLFIFQRQLEEDETNKNLVNLGIFKIMQMQNWQLEKVFKKFVMNAEDREICMAHFMSEAPK